MPVVVAPTDIIEVKAYTVAPDGQVAINRTHWQIASVTTGSVTLQEIATALEATLSPSYIAWMPTGATWYGLTTKKLTAPASIPFFASAHRGPGTGGDLLVPKQATGLIYFHTDVAGASQRGRLYIPFIDSLNVGPKGEINLVGLPKLNAIKTAYGLTQTIVGVGGTAVMQLMIYNPSRPAAVRLPTTIGVEASVATQKRRGAFGKTNSLPF